MDNTSSKGFIHYYISGPLAFHFWMVVLLVSRHFLSQLFWPSALALQCAPLGSSVTAKPGKCDDSTRIPAVSEVNHVVCNKYHHEVK